MSDHPVQDLAGKLEGRGALITGGTSGIGKATALLFAKVGARDAVAYCTSKGAVIQLTLAMALDHARENIRINAICPGDTFVDCWLDEGYFEGSEGVDMEHALKESGVGLPLGRVAMPEEIAKTVLFLASDDSSYMTGSILMVDGGNTAR